MKNNFDEKKSLIEYFDMVGNHQSLDYSLFNVDALDNDKCSALMYALIFNKEKALNLSDIQLDYLIRNTNLRQQDNYKQNALMYAITYSKTENINLNPEQIDYLIKNTDLNQQTTAGFTALMYLFSEENDDNLNFNEEQVGYLIKNSDLKTTTNHGDCLITFMLLNKNLLNFTNEHYDCVINAYDFKDKANHKTLCKLLSFFIRKDNYHLFSIFWKYNNERDFIFDFIKTNSEYQKLLLHKDLVSYEERKKINEQVLLTGKKKQINKL